MVLLEMPNGARATLKNGEWTSSTLGLANLLETMMEDCHPGPADGDPEYHRAHHVAQRVAARILESTPSYEYVPERVYQPLRTALEMDRLIVYREAYSQGFPAYTKFCLGNGASP